MSTDFYSRISSIYHSLTSYSDYHFQHAALPTLIVTIEVTIYGIQKLSCNQYEQIVNFLPLGICIIHMVYLKNMVFKVIYFLFSYFNVNRYHNMCLFCYLPFNREEITYISTLNSSSRTHFILWY